MSIVVGVLLLVGGVLLFAFRHSLGDMIRANNMRQRWLPMGLPDEWESRYGTPIAGVIMAAVGITVLVVEVVRFAWR